ncbi:unnamed protein product [Cladocopium goreaui]|uniref:Uncharacterized protein n=1 Tax=Cladocopium goreaui TaxID=2562237 RepID=A0A9P1C3C7_9DINO|nr:unnamed protein product [Cladocopium goreaui]
MPGPGQSTAITSCQRLQRPLSTKRSSPRVSRAHPLRNKANPKARDLVVEEKVHFKKFKDAQVQEREPVKPPPFALAAPAVHFDADHRPRYATTKMTPDELEERPMNAKGLGKGDMF